MTASINDQILISQYSVKRTDAEEVTYSVSMSLPAFLGLACCVFFSSYWLWITLITAVVFFNDSVQAKLKSCFATVTHVKEAPTKKQASSYSEKSQPQDSTAYNSSNLAFTTPPSINIRGPEVSGPDVEGLPSSVAPSEPIQT